MKEYEIIYMKDMEDGDICQFIENSVFRNKAGWLVQRFGEKLIPLNRSKGTHWNFLFDKGSGANLNPNNYKIRLIRRAIA